MGNRGIKLLSSVRIQNINFIQNGESSEYITHNLLVKSSSGDCEFLYRKSRVVNALNQHDEKKKSNSFTKIQNYSWYSVL